MPRASKKRKHDSDEGEGSDEAPLKPAKTSVRRTTRDRQQKSYAELHDDFESDEGDLIIKEPTAAVAAVKKTPIKEPKKQKTDGTPPTPKKSPISSASTSGPSGEASPSKAKTKPKPVYQEVAEDDDEAMPSPSDEEEDDDEYKDEEDNIESSGSDFQVDDSSSGSEYGKKKKKKPAATKAVGRRGRKPAAKASPMKKVGGRGRGRGGRGASRGGGKGRSPKAVPEKTRTTSRRNGTSGGRKKYKEVSSSEEEEEDIEESVEEEDSVPGESSEDQEEPQQKKEKPTIKPKPKPTKKSEDDEEIEEEEEEEEEEEDDSSAADEEKEKKPSAAVANKKGEEKKEKKEESEEEEEEEEEKEKEEKIEKVKEEKVLKNKVDTDLDSIDFSTIKKTISGENWDYKVSSWNVGGIKAWLNKNGLKYLKAENPDCFCLQEIRCGEKTLPAELVAAIKEDYPHTYYNFNQHNPGHSGVAIFSKTKPETAVNGLPIDDSLDEKDKKMLESFNSDGRLITLEFDSFYVINAYVPNSGQGVKADGESKPYPPKVTNGERMKFDELFKKYIIELEKKKPVILTGDLNVAHKEIDLANPKTNNSSAGFTKEEREDMTKMLEDTTLFDSFRFLYPEQKSYTFWSYRNNARAKDVGWRLDYYLLSSKLKENNLCDNVMRKEVYGSDHCPIVLFMKK